MREHLLAILLTTSVILSLFGCGNLQNRDASPSSQASNAPLYVYLFDHTEDHINTGEGDTLGPSEERWYRVLNLLTDLRDISPDATLDQGPWVNLQFHGAEANSVQDRNAQTAAAWEGSIGLMEFLRQKMAEGVMDLGYHGAHEPTYENNTFSTLTHEDIAEMPWDDLQQLVYRDLTCWRHPTLGVEGVPDYCKEDDSGGMLEVIKVLLNGDEGTPGIRVVSGLQYPLQLPAGTFVVDRFTTDPMGFGYDDHKGESGEVSPQDEDYYDAVSLVLDEMASIPGSVYGLHFMGSMAVTSLLGDKAGGFGRFNPDKGLDELKRRLGGLPHDMPQLVKMHLATKYIYSESGRDCRSPTWYAYEHPDDPKLEPGECLVEGYPESAEEYYTNLRDELVYLISEVFPDRPGSAIVTPASLAPHIGRAYGFEVTRAQLGSAAEALTANPAELPYFTMAGDVPLSHAELFRALVEALSVYGTQAALPDKVRIERLRGLDEFDAFQTTDRLRGDQVIMMASQLASRYALQPGEPDTLYAPPPRVQFHDGQTTVTVTTPGALWAMCEAFLTISDQGSIGTGDTVLARDVPVRDKEVRGRANGEQDTEGKGGPFSEASVWQLKPIVWQ